MSTLHCSGRKSTICHLLVYGLDVERSNCHETFLAERRADVFLQQALVAFVGLGTNTRLDGLQPLIEILIQSNPGAIGFALSPQLIDLLSEELLRLGITTERDANHPGVFANCDDLT